MTKKREEQYFEHDGEGNIHPGVSDVGETSQNKIIAVNSTLKAAGQSKRD
jgi:hypothetical protein